ncbi:NAD(P)-binding protein [Russula vinacea]|nr:NAD(P)-binding protein [Russula vinacea]
MPQRRIGILSQLVPPKAAWTAENAPDQTGKIAIITGGQVEVGKETARVLLSKGAKVYIACRNAEKAHQAIDELKGYSEKDSIFFLKLDLADLTSIKAAADEFLQKESELHMLYNNHGITYAPSEKVTAQGFDITFGTNVLGHFYLTKLLLPLLVTTAKKSPAGTIRVINVSSIAHYMAAPEGIRWSTLGPEDDAHVARRKLGITRVYGQSKLGNILFSNELARRYGDDGIASISLFPGAVKADLSGYAGSFCSVSSGWLERVSVYHRATTSLYAGTAPEAGRLGGKYLTAWARLSLPSKMALNTRLAAKLWDWCENKIRENTTYCKV